MLNATGNCPNFSTIITQVATFYTHSTPLECNSLKYAPSIDIPPLWGEERDEKSFLEYEKPVSSNLGYYSRFRNYFYTGLGVPSQ